MCTHAHTHTHAHARTYTHVHTHTHTSHPLLSKKGTFDRQLPQIQCHISTVVLLQVPPNHQMTGTFFLLHSDISNNNCINIDQQ